MKYYINKDKNCIAIAKDDYSHPEYYFKDGKSINTVGAPTNVTYPIKLKPEVLNNKAKVMIKEDFQVEVLRGLLEDIDFKGSIHIGRKDLLHIFAEISKEEKDNEELFFSIYHDEIDFWDAFEIDENEKGDEMKYEWNVDELCIFNIVNNIYNINDQKDFVHFCFKKQVNYDSFVSTKSRFSKILLEEIQKPEKEHWLKYAIESGYVKKIPTYKTVWVNLYLVRGDISTSQFFPHKEYAELSVDKTGSLGEYLKTVSIEIPED